MSHIVLLVMKNSNKRHLSQSVFTLQDLQMIYRVVKGHVIQKYILDNFFDILVNIICVRA